MRAVDAQKGFPSGGGGTRIFESDGFCGNGIQR